MDHEFDRAIDAHDAAVAALGLSIWVGSEPTFTDRFSEAPEWLSAAAGEAKERVARRILARLHRQSPDQVVLRTLGRCYPGESALRWSFGLYGLRDGTPVWSGPPDPMLEGGGGAPPDLDALQYHLAGALREQGFSVAAFSTACDRSVAFGPRSRAALEPAGEGALVVVLTGESHDDVPVARVGMPAFPDVAAFRTFLAAVGRAARACRLTSLVLGGCAPPVDASVLWSTWTPDPGVLEANMAPYPGVRGLLTEMRRLFAAAQAEALAPVRLYYNGVVSDSGGAGHITLGGPSPAESPFVRELRLLPRLLRFVNRHPALSYCFAHDHVGSGGQSVRTDERGDGPLAELALELELIARAQPDAETLWRALAPSLADAAGNSHRAELNVEKLWNPYDPVRGRLGLVEFRAFRMPPTPERAAAVVALVRAVVAMLAVRDYAEPLVDWGAALHDRFALPFYLEEDLRTVLAEIDRYGVRLAPAIVRELDADWRQWAVVAFEGCELTIRRALEFWPLIGDATSAHGTSRLVDASTSRIEVTLRSATDLDAWQLSADGIELPLRRESDARGPARVFGIRHRSFVPWQGLHPTLGAQDPVRLALSSPRHAEALTIALHHWRPDQAAYDGLPADAVEAAARRAARCIVRRVPRPTLPPPRAAPANALSPWSIDLRRVPPRDTSPPAQSWGRHS